MKLSVPLIAMLLSSAFAVAEEVPAVSSATTDDNGFLVHQVDSPYQAGKTQIRVLLPDNLNASQKYPVVFVLPVEARNENRYGDGLLEIKNHDLHNKYRAVFVAPTFSHLPWYADHPTDPAIRQETYFLEVVLPFVEENYPVRAERRSRLLLGFSKSGWGSWKARQTEPFDPTDYEREASETIEMERQSELRRNAADLLLVERAREWLLEEEP